jgi:ATPase subunit of ABC transporter with duplicated ATPase domains
VLHGLGFNDAQIEGDVGALSGGWKMRVGMAKVLLGNSDVLLLDEPTNHLDIESILWLEQFLQQTKSAVLMTCHDRDFMNRVVDRIIDIDNGEFVSYTGDYDFMEREQKVRAAAARGPVRTPAGDDRQDAALHRPLRHARGQGRAGAEQGEEDREDREDRAAEEARGRAVRLQEAAALRRRRRQAVRRQEGLRREASSTRASTSRSNAASAGA